MFTGIIQAVGKVVAVEPRDGDRRLRIDGGGLGLGDTRIGDSIAVSGVCLTAIEVSGSMFVADVSRETLACTTFDALQPGQRVNLEKALLPTSRLGGHLVSGHVDGVGEVRERVADARSERFRIEAPEALARYIAAKGSVCVDGVSLTVNSIDNRLFELNIVPHTLRATTLDAWRPGTRVNIEVDQIARYLERLLLGAGAERSPVADPVSRDFLAVHGFLKN